jgi:hypothetical protein
MTDVKENVIEWITGDDWIACTFTQKKYISKVRKIAIKYPQFVPVFIENKDGSIFCHLPLKALKLSVIISEKRGFKKREVESDG